MLENINFPKTAKIIILVLAIFLVLMLLLRIPLTFTETVEAKRYHLDNPEEFTTVSVTIKRTYRFRPFSDCGIYVHVQFDDKERNGRGSFWDETIFLAHIVNNMHQTWGELWRVKGFDKMIITVWEKTQSGTRTWNNGDGEVIVCGELSHEEVVEYFAP